MTKVPWKKWSDLIKKDGDEMILEVRSDQVQIIKKMIL
jgi:hypothetical protein